MSGGETAADLGVCAGSSLFLNGADERACVVSAEPVAHFRDKILIKVRGYAERPA